LTGKFIVFMALVGLAALPLQAATDPGDFDKSFGGDGRVRPELPGSTSGEDAALMRDGRILVVGDGPSGDTVVQRFLPSGRLDDSFSGNGWLSTDSIPSPQRPKIIAGRRGSAYVVAAANSDLLVMKLNRRGRLVEGYGTDGVMPVDFGGSESMRGLVPGQGGKFYAFGQSHDGTGNSAIARFNANGSLDTNTDADPSSHWGEDGKVLVASGQLPLGLTELKSGKVLICREGSVNDSVIMQRFTSKGDVDTTYHGTGETEVSIGADSSHTEKVTFGKRAMYVGANTDGADRDIRIAKFRFSGEAEDSFDEDGGRTYDLGGDEHVSTTLEAADGRIVVVGSSGPPTEVTYRWFVLRLKPSGRRDRGFGDNGVRITRFHPEASEETSEATDIDIQADGRILATGRTSPTGSDFDFGLARYLSGTCGTIGTKRGDALLGSPARDFMCGRGGGDTIKGRGGRDRLVGGPGPDLLNGGKGVDICVGGRGRDTLRNCER
jgi:uncharacterized delta-60 repeat protein